MILGPEIIQNGTFDTSDAWTLGRGWSIQNGLAVFDVVNDYGQGIKQTVYLTAPAYYLLSFRIPFITGQFQPQFNNSIDFSLMCNADYVQAKSTGIFQFILQVRSIGEGEGGGEGNVIFMCDLTKTPPIEGYTVSFAVDNISLRKILSFQKNLNG